jgi:hypothetical protein
MSLVGRLPGVLAARDLFLARLGIPPEVVPHLTFPSTFSAQATRRSCTRWECLHRRSSRLREGALGALVAVPRPAQGPPPQPGRACSPGRTVAVTGRVLRHRPGGRACGGAQGRDPLLLARRVAELEAVRDEIVSRGGTAQVYSVDLTDAESIDACVKQMLADHDASTCW